MSEKQYVGRAKYKTGENSKGIWEEWQIFIKIDGKPIKLKMRALKAWAEKKQKDEFGNTHCIYIDDFTPDTNYKKPIPKPDPGQGWGDEF